jgi:hypothetical protein
MVFSRTLKISSRSYPGAAKLLQTKPKVGAHSVSVQSYVSFFDLSTLTFWFQSGLKEFLCVKMANTAINFIIANMVILSERAE